METLFEKWYQELYLKRQQEVLVKNKALTKVWSYLNTIEDKSDEQQKLFDDVLFAISYISPPAEEIQKHNELNRTITQKSIENLFGENGINNYAKTHETHQ